MSILWNLYTLESRQASNVVEKGGGGRGWAVVGTQWLMVRLECGLIAKEWSEGNG